MSQRIEYGSDSVEWKWWSGELLSGTVERPLAFDTETELIQGPLHWPRIALGMAFDGARLVLIHPTRIGEFLAVHRRQHIVAHNVVFDWWVCHEHLKGRVEQRLLWDSAKADRWHCSMILNQLLQLATGQYSGANGGGGSGEETRLYPANISVACETEGLPSLSKDDPYRLRFGELLGLSEAEMEAHAEFNGFIDYALKDVIAAYRLYERQRVRALKLVAAVGDCPHQVKGGYQILPGAVEKWGPLTEAIQVKGAIVLEEMSRHPLPIDRVERQLLEDEARRRYQSAYDALLAESPNLFKRFPPRSKRAGEIKMTARSQVPQMDTKELKAVLQRIADEKGFPVPLSDGAEGGISTSAKAWAKLAHQHPFIAAWVELEDWAKHLEFLRTIDADAIYTRYNLLMRSGRTSAGAHKHNKKLSLPSCNVQQLPREGDFRSLFVAPPGKVYIATDFSYVELRTLAATAAARYGFSKLKDAIVSHTKHGGLDPHQVMAASILEVEDDEYLRLPKDVQKSARQQAKACNFGFPGGLGVEKFRAFAAASYDVHWTTEQARENKRKWLDRYDEMKLWLGDRTRHALRYQLGSGIDPILNRLSDVGLRMIVNLLRESELSKPRATEAAWSMLENLLVAAKRWDLLEDVNERQVTRRLRQVVTDYMVTLTGRIRANTAFTEINTLFQGLAADAAKAALFEMRYRGLKPVMFIHDEVVVECNESDGERVVKQVERIMNESLESVLDGVPSAVESEIGRCWAKP